MLGPPFDDRWELYGQLHRLTDQMVQLEADIGANFQFFEIEVTPEQRDRAQELMREFYFICEKLVPKAVVDASAVVFRNEEQDERTALCNLIKEIRPKPSAYFSTQDARVIELEPLMTALQALNVGETLPLLERNRASGKSTRNYTLLMHKLLALGWQAYLAKRTKVPKAATQDVCDAFGVSRQALSNWKGQCETGLGAKKVESVISFAERETSISTDFYTVFFRNHVGLPNMGEAMPIQTLDELRERLMSDGAAYAAVAGR